MSDENESPRGEKVDVVPATPERWDDLERLFGPRGADQGCWCMYWRQTRTLFSANRGAGNRVALKALVDEGETPGLLAYTGGRAVGWCSISPRSAFGALNRSRVLKAVDDQPVWSIVCFFVAKPFRRQGISGALLRAAVQYVRERGGRIVEAYPSRIQHEIDGSDAYMGIADAFEEAGFVEVTRPRPDTAVMRYVIAAELGQ